MRILFYNGHVWQSQQQREPPASWLLISDEQGGEILAVGSGEVPLEHRVGSDIVDLKGAVVLPGLQDAHIHVGYTGESAHYVELSDCHSVAEVQQAIGHHAEANPKLPWIIGTGWDQNLWSPAKTLTRLDLDVAIPDGRPCLLYRRCWHAVAVNSAALRAAGADPEKPWSPSAEEVSPPSSPPGDGREVDRGGQVKEVEDRGQREGKRGVGAERGEGVEVDSSGRPTGLFREGSLKIVENAITAASFDTRCEQFAEALQRCVRSGLTAVHSNDDDAIQVYARLQEEGRLPVRVYLTLPFEELEKKEQVADAEDVGDTGKGDARFSNGRPKPWSGNGGLVSWNRVKLFSDGSLGAETAAMRLPYLDTDNRGVLIHSPTALTRKVAQARDRGFRVEVHAIGDWALATVLDAFDGAGLTAEDRPIVTHCQVAGPDLVARMRKVGAVAAVQPSFVPSDAAVVMQRLSPSMHESCYPWRSLLYGGVTCAGSSDAPIETYDPFRGMYDAVVRPNRPPASQTPGPPFHLEDGGEPNQQASANASDGVHTSAGSADDTGDTGVAPFLPDERLTLEEAVWIYTVGGAVAAGEEKKLGMIRPGFLADITIVEVPGGGESLLEKPSLLLEAKVSQVWVGGKCRWDSNSLADNGTKNKPPSPSLSGSDMPGKNGPKRKRTRSASGDGGRGSYQNNPWLAGGIGRMGRCRYCS